MPALTGFTEEDPKSIVSASGYMRAKVGVDLLYGRPSGGNGGKGILDWFNWTVDRMKEKGGEASKVSFSMSILFSI